MWLLDAVILLCLAPRGSFALVPAGRSGALAAMCRAQSTAVAPALTFAAMCDEFSNIRCAGHLPALRRHAHATRQGLADHVFARPGRSSPPIGPTPTGRRDARISRSARRLTSAPLLLQSRQMLVHRPCKRQLAPGPVCAAFCLFRTRRCRSLAGICSKVKDIDVFALLPACVCSPPGLLSSRPQAPRAAGQLRRPVRR